MLSGQVQQAPIAKLCKFIFLKIVETNIASVQKNVTA